MFQTLLRRKKIMNGLEALDSMIETFDCGGYHPATLGCKDDLFKEVFSEELPIIKNDLKVLNLLKEKKVDLDHINYWVNIVNVENPKKYQITIEHMVERYNNLYVDLRRKEQHLTQEEMQIIVDWLKGEEI